MRAATTRQLLGAPERASRAMRYRLLAAAAVVADVGALLVALGISQLVALEVVPIALAVLAIYGLYDRERLSLGAEEARRLFHANTVASAATAFLASPLGLDLRIGEVASYWLASFVALGIARLITRQLVHAVQRRGWVGTPVLVVGTNEEARTIARTLSRQRWLGYHPIGFVTTRAVDEERGLDLPVVADLAELRPAIEVSGARCVVVATTAIEPQRLPSLCASLQALAVDVRISSGLPDIAASRLTIEPIDGLALLSVRRNELAPQQAAVKRVLDVCLGSLLLVAAAPAMALIALLVRLSSRGPVLFSQYRVGKGGKPFRIYKFRTMVDGASELIQVLDLRSQNEADGLLFKLREDPRVTPVGRFLRRLGLDELPQLYNVLRGEMSLVGPRPPLPGEAERYDEWVKGRLRVKPGITGLWQVNGRHELSFDDYVRYDLFYVENWTVTLDLCVLAKTVPALLRRRGAF